MGQVSEAVTLFFAAVMVGALGFEISRRRKRLREVYDVLDKETRHIATELEQLIEQGKLVPYTDDSWV